MLNRRTLLKGAVAGVAYAVLPATTLAAAARNAIRRARRRGFDGIYERMPTLDLESQFDFVLGLQSFALGDLQAAADARADAILLEHDVKPAAEVPLVHALAWLGPDPVIAAQALTMTATQQYKLTRLDHEFRSAGDRYLDELDEAQIARSDRIELHPDLAMPGYAQREIHNQPGGYGNPFAGYIYRYGLSGLFSAEAFQDTNQRRIALTAPVPADGCIDRILELGCALGQMATALKERFPDAEVWGADASASMLRYANKRAFDIGSDVHFKHTLGEDLDFPDDHFDLVSVYIMFHEVAPEAMRSMIRHIARVLRPGGVFYPIDFYTRTAAPADAKSRFAAWLNARWGHEDWREDYATVDLKAEMERAGLIVTGGPGDHGGLQNFVATKPV